jgi:CRISPR-associated protein Csb2
MEMRFLSGRYHATPWGKHANEGDVEWPPSLWRITRALLATWFHKAQDEVEEATCRSLLAKLSSGLPTYYLSRQFVQSETRHYMPLYEFGKPGINKTTKVLDSFLHFASDGEGHADLMMEWTACELSSLEREALALLLERLGYLGRAESWVEARLVEVFGEGDDSFLAGYEVVCPTGQIQEGESGEALRLLAPRRPEEYGAWREERVVWEKERRLLEKQRTSKAKNPPKKLTKKELLPVEAALPESWFEALQAETSLKRLGWSVPPGSVWVDYVVKPSREPLHLRSRLSSAEDPKPEVAVLALSGGALPRLTDAMALTNQLHRAFVCIDPSCQVLRGCDESGDKLKGHEHAYLLPWANEQGRVDHVVVYAKGGLDKQARNAIHRLQRLLMPASLEQKQKDRFSKWASNDNAFRVTLLGFEHVSVLREESRKEGWMKMFATSQEWCSMTPFCPTRHAKLTKRGEPKMRDGWHIDSPPDELRRLLAMNFDASLVDEPPLRNVETLVGGRITRWFDFHTHRREGRGGRRAGNQVWGFERVTFTEPVAGPLVAGYGAHFGLGMLRPVE